MATACPRVTRFLEGAPGRGVRFLLLALFREAVVSTIS